MASPPASRAGGSGTSVRELLSSYAQGMGAGDLQRLFQREAPDAFRVLTRDQPPPPAEEGLGRLTHTVRTLFLGLSSRLGPTRRLLFALALVLTVLGLFDLDVEPFGGGYRLDWSPLFLVSAVGILVFLLALELVDRVRVRDELEVARQLQMSLLPDRAPALPGYQVALSYRTANEIGGDYYDFLEVGDGRVAVVAGDASGHGIAAGLLMVVAHSTLRLAIDLDPSPVAAVDLLNRALARIGGSRAFMTLFYGLLDPESGRLEYVCAGHPFPLLRRASGALESLGSGGLPLGIRDEVEVESAATVLRPGDLLLLYSDGLPEAYHERRGRAFGFPAVEALLRTGGSPRRAHDRVLAALDEFLGDEPLRDDVSLVVLGREPGGGGGGRG